MRFINGYDYLPNLNIKEKNDMYWKQKWENQKSDRCENDKMKDLRGFACYEYFNRFFCYQNPVDFLLLTFIFYQLSNINLESCISQKCEKISWTIKQVF